MDSFVFQSGTQVLVLLSSTDCFYPPIQSGFLDSNPQPPSLWVRHSSTGPVTFLTTQAEDFTQVPLTARPGLEPRPADGTDTAALVQF